MTRLDAWRFVAALVFRATRDTQLVGTDKAYLDRRQFLLAAETRRR